MLILSLSFVLWCLCLLLKSGHDEGFLSLNFNWLDPSSLHPDRFATWRSWQNLAENRFVCLRFFFSLTVKMENEKERIAREEKKEAYRIARAEKKEVEKIAREE